MYEALKREALWQEQASRELPELYNLYVFFRAKIATIQEQCHTGELDEFTEADFCNALSEEKRIRNQITSQLSHH